MTSYSNLYILLHILSHLTILSLASTIKDYEIFDLTTASEFPEDYLEWQLNTIYLEISPPTCDNTNLISGTISDVIQRSYSGLKTHTAIFIILNVWMIGTWNLGGEINFGWDNTGSITIFKIDNPGSSTPVAAFWQTNPITSCDYRASDVIIKISHVASSIDFSITAQTYDPTDTGTFFGVRNLRLLQSNQDQGNQVCVMTSTLVTPIAYCPTTKTYNDASSNPVPCDPACGECFAGTASDCISCAKDFSSDGTSCLTDFPPACPGVQFLYPSKTCRDGCTTPYTSNGVNCEFPCQTSEYLSDSNTCLSSCDSPMVLEATVDDGKLCHAPCRDTKFPYYNTDKKICQSDCSAPYIPAFEPYQSCSPPPPEAPKEIKELASATDVMESVTKISVTIMNAIMVNDPGSITSNMLSKMLQYARFMDVNYSVNIETIFRAQNVTQELFGIRVPVSQDMIDEMDLMGVPPRFEKFYVNASFIVNFWGMLLFLSALFGVFVVLVMLQYMTIRLKEINRFNSITKKIKNLAQNFLIMQFYRSLGDIIFFFAIEARVADYNHLLSLLSLLLAITLTLTGLTLLVTHFIILKKYQNVKKRFISEEDLKDFQTRYEGISLFFITFKDRSVFMQSFLFIFVIRSIIFNLIVALLFEHPLAQTILILCLSLAIVCYLIIFRSFKSVISWLQQLSCEVILLIANICFLIMAAIDIQNEEITVAQQNLEMTVIVCSVIFSFLPTLFLVAKVIETVMMYLKAKKMEAVKHNYDVKELPVAENKPDPSFGDSDGRLLRGVRAVHRDSFSQDFTATSPGLGPKMAAEIHESPTRFVLNTIPSIKVTQPIEEIQNEDVSDLRVEPVEVSWDARGLVFNNNLRAKPRIKREESLYHSVHHAEFGRELERIMAPKTSKVMAQGGNESLDMSAMPLHPDNEDFARDLERMLPNGNVNRLGSSFEISNGDKSSGEFEN